MRLSSSLWGKEVRDLYQDGQRLLYDDDSDWGNRRGMGNDNIFIDGEAAHEKRTKTRCA